MVNNSDPIKEIVKNIVNYKTFSTMTHHIHYFIVFFVSGIPSQLMAILFVLGAACGIFLASILIYLIFGNNLIQIFFKPREAPEPGFKSYFKVLGGSIIYVITSIFSTVGRVLSIPVS